MYRFSIDIAIRTCNIVALQNLQCQGVILQRFVQQKQEACTAGFRQCIASAAAQAYLRWFVL